MKEYRPSSGDRFVEYERDPATNDIAALYCSREFGGWVGLRFGKNGSVTPIDGRQGWAYCNRSDAIRHRSKVKDIVVRLTIEADPVNKVPPEPPFDEVTHETMRFAKAVAFMQQIGFKPGGVP